MAASAGKFLSEFSGFARPGGKSVRAGRCGRLFVRAAIDFALAPRRSETTRRFVDAIIWRVES
ncbi:hypothetical protein [uncultured Phenylobacterium sp.]|uniref:hypothetical protein n=1 Tax=uncultured Phenylobacterium sp. TaxID=349273 RepID=UPI0025D9BF41|nr:hypothetical protein [uncultured Phenylobacterium sp.]